MFICKKCGSMCWEEYVDGYMGVYEIIGDGGIEEIKNEIYGDVILVRCHYCENEDLLSIDDIQEDYEEIVRKLDKLLEIPDEEREKRLELMKKWGWIDGGGGG